MFTKEHCVWIKWYFYIRANHNNYLSRINFHFSLQCNKVSHERFFFAVLLLSRSCESTFLSDGWLLDNLWRTWCAACEISAHTDCSFATSRKRSTISVDVIRVSYIWNFLKRGFLAFRRARIALHTETRTPGDLGEVPLRCRIAYYVRFS